MKKILMLLTSHKELKDTDATTGVWLGEFTDPYYEFIDKGYAVTLVSPKGGKPPIDSMSELTENISTSNRRFKDDSDAQHNFATTKTLSDVTVADFDGLFIPGGHGPLWDLATDQKSGELILGFLDSQKPVAAVCHGPAALIKAAEIQPSVVKGRKITGFTNTEEKMALRSDNIEYNLEDRLKELGADFSSALIPFTSHVVKDGNLITGQNPLSAGPTAEALIEHLESTPS